MIKSLKLENWKAFETFETNFSDGVNFFIGKNASGKTSLLESISVGFTGATLTVDDPKILVRGDGIAKITLEFIKDTRKYRVERSLTKQRYLNARVFCDGQLVEQNWNNVNDYMMNKLGVTKNSFAHVLYMSEGAAFRFLSTPLKEGITKEIEETLNIDRLQGLLDEIEREQKTYKNQETLLLNEQKKLKDFIPVTTEEQSTSSRQASELEQQTAKLRKEIAGKTTNEAALRIKASNYKDILNRADQARSIIQRMDASAQFDQDFLKESSRVIEATRMNYQNLQDEIMQKSKKKGMIEEQITALEKVCSLLHNAQKHPENANCPVCRKSLSITEMESICQEDESKLTTARDELHAIENAITNNKSELLKMEYGLRELSNVNSSLSESISSLNITQPSKVALQNLYGEVELELDETTTQKDALEKQLSDIDTKRLTLARQIERSIVIDELKKAENVDASLIPTAKALMALDLLREATEQTVKAQREQKMTTVYQEMESAWNSILKETETEIRFDDKSIPILYRKGQKYEANQLSGGEKMAILVIMRTILCRKFTSSAFMMLDEPLEHLDSNNRQLIIQFLVESFDKGWIDQLFVTTFEESVLRKFADRAQVNIVAL